MFKLKIHITVECLVRDYRRADEKLKKEKDKGKSHGQIIFDQELEIQKLKQSIQQEQTVMTQFEQEFNHQKEECQ